MRSEQRRGTVSLQKREANEVGVALNAGGTICAQSESRSSYLPAFVSTPAAAAAPPPGETQMHPVEGFDASSTICLRAARPLALPLPSVVEAANWLAPVVHASAAAPGVFLITVPSAKAAEKLRRELPQTLAHFAGVGADALSCERTVPQPSLLESALAHLLGK